MHAFFYNFTLALFLARDVCNVETLKMFLAKFTVFKTVWNETLGVNYASQSLARQSRCMCLQWDSCWQPGRADLKRLLVSKTFLAKNAFSCISSCHDMWQSAYLCQVKQGSNHSIPFLPTSKVATGTKVSLHTYSEDFTFYILHYFNILNCASQSVSSCGKSDL